MINQVSRAIRQIRWDKQDVANFLGCYLSEPKPHIFFDAPERPLRLTHFKQAAHKQGVQLVLSSQMLCRDGWIFINGESLLPEQRDYPVLRDLADQRMLPNLTHISGDVVDLLYQWYLDGYIILT